MSTASNKAAKKIRNLILTGKFPPGLHLKEEELAEICQVSRTPIRDAVRALAVEDYVQIIPNHGTFVSEWPDDDIEDIFQLRAVLESHGARRAANRASPEQIMEMREQVRAINSMLSGNKGIDRDLFLEANNTFHKVLREAAQSPRLKVMISRLISQPVVSRTAMSYERSDLKRSNEHHAELVEAIAAKDGDWAHSVMTSHILAALQIYKRFYLQEESAKTSQSVTKN